ncbi:hypothetical protein QR680_001807 [Steinernema hermaphroditum]|uniref:C3H1-type domain-containing protein n=1 Tax=Steinernema hermaphroditum TaxID=289476 RepID=A0AA39H1M3_9BILA|nr:hypothetical protein QR680_001807 [Steinernema hermaphroditum]
MPTGFLLHRNDHVVSDYYTLGSLKMSNGTKGKIETLISLKWNTSDHKEREDLKRRLIKEQEEMNQAIPDGRRPFYLMHPVTKQARLEELMGKTLRVIVPKIEPPYVNYLNYSKAYEQEQGFGPGVVMEILRQIAVELNLTYQLSYVPDEEWGTFDNGTWSGAFGQLVSGKADIIAGAAIMQYDRSEASDLTYPFQFERTGILIRSPEQYTDNTFLIVTEPFKLEVWGLTAATIAISAVALKFITKCLHNQMETQFSLLQCIWIFFSVFVQQGIPIQPTSWSSRTLLALWWLASVTLLATFTGSLVALFAVDRSNLPFQDFNEMVQAVKNGKYKVVMDGNSQTRIEMIARSQLHVYQDLWHEMSSNNKVTYVDGIAEGIELVKQESGYALLGAMDSLKINVISNCNVVLLAEGILPTYLTIPLRLHSPYSTYFSNRIRQMVEGGFITKWINDYGAWVASQHHNKCDNTTFTKASLSQKGILNLDKAQGAFWILLSGIALSALALICEHVCIYAAKIFLRRRRRHIHSHKQNRTPSTERNRSLGGFGVRFMLKPIMHRQPPLSAQNNSQASQNGGPTTYGIPFTVWHALTDEERAEVKNSKRRGEAYKTALCNTFKMTGQCSYGVHCRFAHGEAELRLVAQSHPKYKTQLCNKFSVVGVCPYGSRCQFIHRRLDVTPRPDISRLLQTTPIGESTTTSSNAFSQSLSAGQNSPYSNNPCDSVFSVTSTDFAHRGGKWRFNMTVPTSQTPVPRINLRKKLTWIMTTNQLCFIWTQLRNGIWYTPRSLNMGGSAIDDSKKEDHDAIAFDLMITAAELGDRSAMLFVAEGYETGNGTGENGTADWPKAIEYFEKVLGFDDPEETNTTFEHAAMSNKKLKFGKNPLVEFGDVLWVNDPAVIRQNPKVTAINSAVELDLPGQVVSDSVGTRFLSGFGGQVGFIRGIAQLSLTLISRISLWKSAFERLKVMPSTD